MSVRTHFPSAKEPDSHFFFTVSRGGRQKRFALRPGALYSLAAGLPLLGAIYLGATAYLFFRDDMVAALMARQARQQYAYEDRLAVIEAAWSVVMADGQRAQEEDALLRLVTNLLGVSDVDSALARQKVTRA